MKKIVQLTEQDINNLVRNILLEAKGQSKEIDNFDVISKQLNLNDPDKFYFVQIIRRKKDNPNARFHYAEYPKHWNVTNGQELLSHKDEIKQICNMYNARAYIRLNPRSTKLATARAGDIIKDAIRKQKTMSYEEAYAIASGHSFKSRQHTNDFPVTMIDIDTTDKNIHQKVLDQLKNAGISVLFTYETLNGGLHIVMPNRDACKLDFKWADGGKDLGLRATVGVDCDAATLLYANLVPTGY